VVAAAIVQALQSIVARNVEPVEAGVITIGHITGGHTFNVIPETVRMLGTARWFAPEIGDLLERRFKETVTGIASAMGASATAEFARAYPATINEVESVHLAAKAARAVAAFSALLTRKPCSVRKRCNSARSRASSSTTRICAGSSSPFIACCPQPLALPAAPGLLAHLPPSARA
jgi:metal-dependent amidase/aminoacylase/carboxypeptidase family protein